MLRRDHSLAKHAILCSREHAHDRCSGFDGPTRIRTWNQGIRFARAFPHGADYLFTRSVDCAALVGCGTLQPVIKGTSANCSPAPR